MQSYAEFRDGVNNFLKKPTFTLGSREFTRGNVADAIYLTGALATAVTILLHPDVRQAVIDSNVPVGTPFVENDHNREHSHAPQPNGLGVPGVYDGVQIDNPEVRYLSVVDVTTIPAQLQTGDFLPR